MLRSHIIQPPMTTGVSGYGCRYLFTFLAFSISLVVFMGGAKAQVPAVAPVPTPFGFKDKNGLPNTTIEPSAVEPIGDGRYLLVGDDKDDNNGHSLTIVETKTGKFIKLLDNIQNSNKNPKWEAMAKDGDGYYYVIGSHGFDPGDSAAKLAARSRLFRFKLVNENVANATDYAIDVKTPTRAGTVAEFDIKTSLAVLGVYNSDPTKIGIDKRVKIEGLAIRTLNGRKQLVIGFREQFDSKGRVQVYYADLPPDSEINGLTPLTLNLFFQFTASSPKGSPVPFKLSSIEYVKELKGFLVMTSTEGNGNAFYGNAIWFISDADIEKSRQPNTKFSLDPVQMVNPGIFEPTMKAEGLGVLPTTVGGKIRLVIVYDNDPQSAHADGLAHPSTMQCVELSSDAKTLSRIPC